MTNDQMQMIVSPSANAAIMPAMDLAMAVDRRRQMVEFVKAIMVDGTDFGTVPGTDKPTLLKPGAEKLTTFFGLTKKFVIMQATEDWTGKEHDGEPFFYYFYRCQLLRGDLLIAEGDGSCNSRESKYRYRWVSESDIPTHIDSTMLKQRGGSISEFAFAIDKAETGGKYGKPTEYWQQFRDAIRDGTARKVLRAARTGKTYDAWEISSTMYQVLNPDVADQVNTIQKMAQKRALVSATLLAVNASEFFTQDIEDMVDGVEAVPSIRAETSPPGLTTSVLTQAVGKEKPDRVKPTRPLSAEQVRDTIAQKAKRGSRDAATDKQVPFLARKFQEAFAGDEKQYHVSLGWLCPNAVGENDQASARNLTLGQAQAVLDWLLDPAGPDDTGDTPLHPMALAEANAVYRQVMIEAGQLEWPLAEGEISAVISDDIPF